MAMAIIDEIILCFLMKLVRLFCGCDIGCCFVSVLIWYIVKSCNKDKTDSQFMQCACDKMSRCWFVLLKNEGVETRKCELPESDALNVRIYC